jgi:hypothetical protein
MNIFVLDQNPKTAAKMHCDKHVVKMVVELYQQLGSALRRHGATDDVMPFTKKGTALKGGYHDHPCTRWTGDTRDNFMWACIHALALSEEYTHRYDKVHFCHDGIKQMAKMSWMIPIGSLTPFAQAMPDEFKNQDAVQAYRDYYNINKRESITCKWDKGRPEPSWWTEWTQPIYQNLQFEDMDQDDYNQLLAVMG